MDQTEQSFRNTATMSIDEMNEEYDTLTRFLSDFSPGHTIRHYRAMIHQVLHRLDELFDALGENFNPSDPRLTVEESFDDIERKERTQTRMRERVRQRYSSASRGQTNWPTRQ